MVRFCLFIHSAASRQTNPISQRAAVLLSHRGRLASLNETIDLEATRIENRLKSRSSSFIEIRPHRWGWKVFEAPGVEPVFREKRHAINYAQERAWFHSGEIRILGSNGIVGRTISLDQLGEDPSRERFRAARVWNNWALQGARILKASASLKRFPDFSEDFSELQ